MGRKATQNTHRSEIFVLGFLVMVAIALGAVLLSNNESVKQRAAEVDRVQRDLIILSEDIQQLSELEKNRASALVEQERLARERLNWTHPGEYIIRIKNQD